MIDDFAIIVFNLLFNIKTVEDLRFITWHLWSHSLFSWSCDWSISLSSIDSITFRENHVILEILELSYSRIDHDSLYLVRCTRWVALWHAFIITRIFHELSSRLCYDTFFANSLCLRSNQRFFQSAWTHRRIFVYKCNDFCKSNINLTN